jgi:phenylalanyl-tRNA synthetase alpha chain
VIEEFRDRLAKETESLFRQLSSATSADEVHSIDSGFAGRKGLLREYRKQIGSFPESDRPSIGQLLDDVSNTFSQELLKALERVGTAPRAINKGFDPTKPGHQFLSGGLHPIVQMMYDLNDAFGKLNFDVFSGPEISSEQFEFDYLNFPPKHPARESMDTFWLNLPDEASSSERLCLRPHLTGASVRYMLGNDPPFRFVYPGRVYRNETTDARHERAFFQYEALIVDRDVPFSAGKLLISTVLETVFGRRVLTRMRTGFFPFVEPGFEIDMQCQVCGGGGCSVCGFVGWLEIMPGGVPHPNVLTAAGLDPGEWTGFYVNVGLDRLVMMRYGIDDVRLFNGGDIQFLEQFK